MPRLSTPALSVGRVSWAVCTVKVRFTLLVPIAIGHVIANLVFDKESLAVATVLEDVHERIDRLEHLTLASLEARQVGGAGDLAYPNGSASDFRNCWGSSWGSPRSRSHPSHRRSRRTAHRRPA